MTTSGVSIYELSRDNIIAAAMRKCGRLAKGQSPDSTDLTNGMQALNAIIAEFQTLGMPLWARAEYNLTMVAGQRDYTFGVGQTINTAFPLHVQGVVLANASGGAVRTLFPEARDDFNLLNRTSTGTPVSFTYQPKVNQGVLSLWPLPDANAVSDYTVRVTYQRPFDGFTSASETPDFPQEWQNALIYHTAVALAPEFGVPLEDRKLLNQEAKMHLDTALQNAAEDASIFFQVDRRR
jgi:hypothetical protein